MLEDVARLLLAPACVIVVSLAGRRWGPTAAGLLGGLPVVAGPILLILTVQHGRTFGSDAAEGCLLGLTALTAFAVVYGLRAPRTKPLATLLTGWAAFLVAVAMLALADPRLGIAVIVTATAFMAGLLLLPAPVGTIGPRGTPPWWDLPARGFAALSLVVALTLLSSALGPTLSGLLAPFPIVTSVLAVFVHAHSGTRDVRLLLRGFLIGFWAFAAFCLVLTLTLPSASVAGAFGLALAAALATQSVVLLGRVLLRPSQVEAAASQSEGRRKGVDSSPAGQ